MSPFLRRTTNYSHSSDEDQFQAASSLSKTSQDPTGNLQPEYNSVHHDSNSKRNPAPLLCILRCGERTVDITRGLFRIDLRGINNRGNPARQAAAQRHEN